MIQLGHVWIVGAGPGDPGLITVRGREVLSQADVVVYDALAAPGLLELAPRGAERIYAGKRAGRAAMPQSAVNALLVEKARAGLRVVRLKGGDPYVFGRGAEEGAFLHEAGVPFEVIPGITAALGASAHAGIPLTHRDEASAVAFVTGHEDPGSEANRLDWDVLARFPGTLVVYMALARLGAICRELIARGMAGATAAAVVENATGPGQRVVRGRLETIAGLAEAAGVRSPALLLVGPVVSRSEALGWRERLPLAGLRVLVTRPAEDVEEAAHSLEVLGAEALRAPMVEVVGLSDSGEVVRAVEGISAFDWLVFTSRHGVTHFFDALLRERDARALAGVKLAVIGEATREALGRYGVRADLVAADARSEGLAHALRDRVAGQRVLLARASRGRDVLPRELAEVCSVETLVVYDQRDAAGFSPEVEHALEAGRVDWVTLTSPAIARRFDALIPAASRTQLQARIQVASISPLTSAEARGLGWRVGAEAGEARWGSLVEALCQANSR